MFSKKGKRKIVVNDNTYYWSVAKEPDMEIDLLVHVWSEEGYLCRHYVEYADKRWEAIGNGGYKMVLGDAPKITPAMVEKIILKYVKDQNIFENPS